MAASETSPDPLVEQMNDVRLSGMDPTPQRRERRFSDADRPPPPAASARRESAATLSKDGSRWIPAPDEVSSITRRRDSAACQTESAPTTSLSQHTCTFAECAVTRLFETTELLECILGFSITNDVLPFRLINHKWNATIEQSPELRLNFFVLPQWLRPSTEFSLLPLSMPGLETKLGQPIDLGQWVQVTMTAEAARRIVPEHRLTRRVRSRSIFEGMRGGLGSRTQKSSDPWPASKTSEPVSTLLQYADLHLTQPPILGMQAFILSDEALRTQQVPDSWDDEEVDNDTVEPSACAKLACDAGITVGFLAETAQSLLGSSAPSNDRRRVLFTAIVSFCQPAAAPPRRRTNVRSVTRLG